MMAPARYFRNNSGFMLVMALWSLALLSILAVSMGVQARQKILFLSRIEKRSELPHVSRSGMTFALTILKKHLAKYREDEIYSAADKAFLYNNPSIFSQIPINGGIADIRREDFGPGGNKTYYGITDEERKININYADRETLLRLVGTVVKIDEERGTKIAEAIFDWRAHGESQAVGFYSDRYYENLIDPYAGKDAPFERIEELLLLQGMDREVFDQLEPYVTIYGEGRININTASAEVFTVLGFSEELVDKVLSVRRGPDGLDATEDDFIFRSVPDIAANVKAVVELPPEEVAQINDLLARNLLTVRSHYYQIKSTGRLNQGSGESIITCVYNALSDRIESWRESR